MFRPGDPHYRAAPRGDRRSSFGALGGLGGELTLEVLRYHGFPSGYHASFGTWDLRLGVGYGAFEPARAPHVTGTLAYGVRSVRDRYAKYPIDYFRDDRPRPANFAEASAARVFVTLRRAYDDAANRELSFGVELSSTFFLPPYSRMRLSGGRP